MNKNQENPRPYNLSRIINMLPFDFKEGPDRSIDRQKITYVGNCLFEEAIITYSYCNQQKLACQPFGWSRKKWLAVQFIKLVEVHFIEYNSPAFYASHLNLAQPYLREICKKELMHPPSYWINLRKILASMVLLLKQELMVKEIAFEVGFVDVSYFIRLFKKYLGVSPNAFRELLTP